MLRPLLYLLHVNDLQFASDLLGPIMFADDANLFYWSKDVNFLFLTVNKELQNMNRRFIANKISLNLMKTKYLFFIIQGKKQYSSRPSELNINNHEIEMVQSIKFLSVLLDKNLTLKLQIKYIENKIAKQISDYYSSKNKTILKQRITVAMILFVYSQLCKLC